MSSMSLLSSFKERIVYVHKFGAGVSWEHENLSGWHTKHWK